MKNGLMPCLVLAVLGVGQVAWADARPACNVNADIIDTDPKGTNVRAAPGGAILAALKNPGDGWIAVHVSGQMGDWYQIDRARLIDAGGPPEGSVIFHGQVWLHKSVLGVNGMHNGGVIYTDHDPKSRPIDAHAAGEQTVALLGCWGDYWKVRARKGIGWTKDICTNMNATCS
jgi:hypothetical protein